MKATWPVLIVGALSLVLSACAGQSAQAPATVVVTETRTEAPVAAPTVTVTAPAPESTSISATAMPTSEAPVEPAGVRIGKSQDVGPLTITLEEYEEIRGSAGQKIVELWFRVENNDNRKVSPFCGGIGDVVIDSQGREFEGESLLEGYTTNCDDLNPGLSAYPFVLRFTVPEDADIVEARAWGDWEYEDVFPPGIWSIN